MVKKMERLVEKKLVAPCGKYCGSCGSFLRRECSGCREEGRSAGCKVRQCAHGQGLNTCAECGQYTDVMQCTRLNSFYTRLLDLLSGRDRKAEMERLKEIGPVRYAREMHYRRQCVVKKYYRNTSDK